MKVEAKKEARRLREKCGWSLNRISKKLNVSKSSVSLWVRDIKLSPKQKAELGYNISKGSNKKHYQKIRDEYREMGRLKVLEEGEDYKLGCLLYWAEGSKGRTVVDFTNRDPIMMKMFIAFLRNYFDCSNEDFTIHINAYLTNGLGVDDITKYWLDILGLQTENVRAFTNRAKYYDPHNERIKQHHKYGVCKLRVNSVKIAQIIFGSIEKAFGAIIDN